MGLDELGRLQSWQLVSELGPLCFPRSSRFGWFSIKFWLFLLRVEDVVLYDKHDIVDHADHRKYEFDRINV